MRGREVRGMTLIFGVGYQGTHRYITCGVGRNQKTFAKNDPLYYIAVLWRNVWPILKHFEFSRAKNF